jgi:hypothetical protein
VRNDPLTTSLADPADTTATQPEASGAPATGRNPAVAAAFVLGWRLVELYDRDALPPPHSCAGAAIVVPQHLPGASEMTDHERASVLLAQASAALTISGPS